MTGHAATSVRESDLVPRPDKGPTACNVRAHTGPGPWLTVLPDGTVTSSSDPDGEYQVAYRDGDRVFWQCLSQYPSGCLGLPIWKNQ